MLTLNELSLHLYDKDANSDIRNFLGSFIIDRGLLKNRKKLFYTQSEKSTEGLFKVLDEKKFHKYNHTEWGEIELWFDRGVIGEFFGTDKFKIALPLNTDEGNIDITSNLITYFLGPLARSRTIDDLYFNVIKQLINGLGVYYNFTTRKIGFGNKPRKKYLLSGGKKVNFTARQYTLEEVLAAELKQGFVNKEIGDPHRDYGYTHLLRQYAKFDLTNWGKNVLINWKKYNILAATRGQGKTYLACLIAARALLDTRPGFGGRGYREIKYFVPNKEDIGTQVMEYIKSFIGDLHSVKLPGGKKAFEFKGNNYVKCNITGNVFKIISLYRFGQGGELGSALGEGLACDTAIIDEAARIPDEFWISFHQRAAFETQEFYISSTINLETPTDHWFYDLLVRGESGEENITSHRITLEENEIMRRGKTNEEWNSQINLVKSDLRKRGEKEFYCRVYCIILEESNVFQLAGAVVTGNTNKYSTEDPRILGFDLGKLDDTAGLSIINLAHMEIESSIKVSNLTYGQQLEYAKEYKEQYPNLLVIGDRSGVGEAVSEQDTSGVVDVWIKSTGQGDINYNRKYGYYTASKGFIINNLAGIFNGNIIKIPGYNVELIEQLNNFIKMKSGRGEVVLYQGKGKAKDDLVLSTAYAAFYMVAVLGLKTKEDIEDYVKQTCNTTTYSYNNSEVTNNSGYYNRFY